ncbi:MAG: ATP-grasp domain-containing protein [Candidatus Heimdallarchaeota archaeon]
MKDLKIVVTACGCPGASTLIKMLKLNHNERKITIVGTDVDEEAIGRFLVENFYTVPPGNSDDYISSMLEIIKNEKPDVLFPESSSEVYYLAKAKDELEATGTRVLVSDPEPIDLANNKFKMYEILKEKTNIVFPEYYSAKSLDEFLKVAEKLGYPEKAILFKPQVGKGSRGVRIMDPKISRKEQLLEKKPTSKYMSLEEFKTIFEYEEIFPEFVVMEYIRGQETTADTIALKGEELFTTVKSVEQARWGVIVRGELIKRPDLVEQTREILKAIPLSYCNNIQFINEYLIEINPRVSSFIYQDNMNAPYLAVKLLLDEIDKKTLKSYTDKIDYGRRMVRYMDQIFHKGLTRIL